MHKFMYSRVSGVSEVVWDFVCRQGGLSHRCDIFMERKMWVKFWPHFRTGGQLL